MLVLKDSVTSLKGIGPQRAKLLEKLQIRTIEDLIFHVPKGYEDKSVVGTFTRPDTDVAKTYSIVVQGQGTTRYIRKNLSLTKFPITNAGVSGELTFFNQPYKKNFFKVGKEYKVFGKLSVRGRFISLINPEIVGDSGRLVEPIYPLTQGLTQKNMRDFVQDALLKTQLMCPMILSLKMPGLLTFAELIKSLHFPKSEKEGHLSRSTLAMEELVLLQLSLKMDRLAIGDERRQGIELKWNEKVSSFIGQLPFSLTPGQKKAVNEIAVDLGSKNQTERLVQGDVGSGKTVVACIMMYLAYTNGYQSVLMAPTEILAKQHENSIKGFLPSELSNLVICLTGSLSEKKKKEYKEKIESGEAYFVIGTHALLEENVRFKKLGLTVTDEQHRFGVNQRKALQSKSEGGNYLIMTATPIPRTLAITFFGDMSITDIKGLPPGRQDIRTYAISSSIIERLYTFIEGELKKGRQAYFVCPMIEENQGLEIKSTETLYQEIKKSNLAQFSAKELHGKLNAQEKNEIIKSFEDGDVDILISTTVIEVGVNVPNATVMVVFNAERFGLAQIHQLRGRVGRGVHQSYCILINEGDSEIAVQRMKTLQSTTDGFEIAEKDLELRGPGEFYGLKQHGIPRFLFADLSEDYNKIIESKKIAEELLLRYRNTERWKDIQKKVSFYKIRLSELNL